MCKEIKFKKSRIVFGLLFSVLMLSFSIWFIVDPEIFIRNFLMEMWHIQLIGIIGVIFFTTLLYSFIKIYNRKWALRITNDYFIDNTKYEAIGKTLWENVEKIQRKKKYTLEIFLKENITSYTNQNLVQKFLLFMQNWNYNKSILISSALLECDIEELEEMMSVAYENYKLK